MVDVQKREDQLLDKISDLIAERDELRAELAVAKADLWVATEAALAVTK